MAKAPFDVRFYRSAVKGKRPAAADMSYGDLAINYNHENPALIIKGDDNALIEFNPSVPPAIGATPPAGAVDGDLWWDTVSARLMVRYTSGAPPTGAWVDASPAAVPAAVVDATAAVKGVVRLADTPAVTAGTAGRVVDAAQLKAVRDAIIAGAPPGTTAPTPATAGMLWVDTTTPTAPVVKVYNGTAWVAVGGGDATTAVKGVVQLADAAAVNAGTAARVIDAAQLKALSDNALLGETGWACSDQITDLAAGLRVSDRWIGSKTLLGVRLHCTVAPTGSPIIVGIKHGTTELFSTKPHIDIGKLTSVGSTVTPVLAATSIADGTDIHITIDQVGSTAKGQGLIVYLLWRRN